MNNSRVLDLIAKVRQFVDYEGAHSCAFDAGLRHGREPDDDDGTDWGKQGFRRAIAFQLGEITAGIMIAIEDEKEASLDALEEPAESVIRRYVEELMGSIHEDLAREGIDEEVVVFAAVRLLQLRKELRAGGSRIGPSK